MARQLLRRKKEDTKKVLLLLLLHPVFCCLPNYKLLFLGESLAVALTGSLSPRRLTLLSDDGEVLRRARRGEPALHYAGLFLCCTDAASSHLILHFCPLRLTHTHTHTYTDTQDLVLTHTLDPAYTVGGG